MCESERSNELYHDLMLEFLWSLLSRGSLELNELPTSPLRLPMYCLRLCLNVKFIFICVSETTDDSQLTH